MIKMTDNEIIKSFMCCNFKHSCEHCGYRKMWDGSSACIDKMFKDALGLIKKLQKQIKKTKAEAIKEFADRLKEMKYQSSEWSRDEHPFIVDVEDIDYLVEEMTEDLK